MSVQERAQAHISQLDKEVRLLRRLRGHPPFHSHLSSDAPALAGLVLRRTSLTICLYSCPSTPPLTTSRSRPRCPRSTPFWALAPSTSSSSSSTLLASSLSTSRALSSRGTTRCRRYSARARSMTLRYVPSNTRLLGPKYFAQHMLI
jgi:hypothetical protein